MLDCPYLFNLMVSYMPQHALINAIPSHINDILQSVTVHPSVSCLLLHRNLHKCSFLDTLPWENISGPSSQIPLPQPRHSGGIWASFHAKAPRGFFVTALNDNMHSSKILHGDETCSLPGNCCLHMLQIRKCTWQRKCCEEALKTPDFRRICTQPRWTVSPLLLISHCVFPKLSSFVTSLPELPCLSISDCKNTWMWLRAGHGKKKRWDEMNEGRSQPHMVTALKLL